LTSNAALMVVVIQEVHERHNRSPLCGHPHSHTDNVMYSMPNIYICMYTYIDIYICVPTCTHAHRYICAYMQARKTI
jgi:hypothetical protein